MQKLLTRWLMLRPGEERKTGYFLLLNILLGVGMAIGRASSEALFFNRVGVDQLPRVYILLSLLLFVASLVYAAFVDRWSAERLMRGFAITLMALLLANGLLIQFADGAPAYYGYFLLYELVSEILIIHMAHYLGQNLDLGQGKRLMPTILAGNQIGIVIGGLMVAALSGLLPTVGFIYIWAGATLLALLLLQSWHRRMGRSPFYYPKPQRRATLQRTLQEVGQGARALWTIPLARASAVSLFLMVIAFYLLNFAVNKVYVAHYPEEQTLVAFFGWLNAGLSMTAILTQMLLSNRVIGWLGIKQVNLLYPICNIISFGALVLSFSLPSAFIGSFNRGVLLPAFHSPARNLILSVMAPRLQGRVRAAMLGLVMPFALVLCGVAIDWLVSRYPFELVLWIGGAVSLLYFGSNVVMNRCYHQELVSSLKDKIFMRNIEAQGIRPDNDIITLIARGIDSDDDDNVAFFAEMMARYYPTMAARKISAILPGATDPMRDRLLVIATEKRLALDTGLLQQLLEQGDEHLKATILRLLSLNGNKLADTLSQQFIEHDNPRIRIESLRHQLCSEKEPSGVEPLWQEMFTRDNQEQEIALASLAEQVVRLEQPAHMISAYQRLFVKMLKANEERTLATVLQALSHWHFAITSEMVPLLERQLQGANSHLRLKAYKCLALLPKQRAEDAAWTGLEELNPQIRQYALNYLQQHCNLGPAEVVERISAGSHSHPRQVMTLLEYVEDKGMPRSAYETMAEGLLATARRFAAARVWMVKQGEELNSRTEILMHTLHERFHQMLDASLAALQGSENREELRIVRAILASGDSGSRATASEVIHHIHNRELARRLMETIELAGDFDHCAQRYLHLFANRKEAHDWCRKREDRWLYELVTD